MPSIHSFFPPFLAFIAPFAVFPLLFGFASLQLPPLNDSVLLLFLQELHSALMLVVLSLQLPARPPIFVALIPILGRAFALPFLVPFVVSFPITLAQLVALLILFLPLPPALTFTSIISLPTIVPFSLPLSCCQPIPRFCSLPIQRWDQAFFSFFLSALYFISNYYIGILHI